MGTVFAAAAGYAFGKLQFRGRNAIFLVLLLTMMIPPLVTVPVNFILMSKLGLINTLWAVILPQLAPAFGIFWMRQYAITSIPDTVLEAAEIDGAGTLRTFWTVGLPMMRPGLAGLAIYLFMMGWNQFLLPLTYLQSNEKQTYTVFLSNLNSSYAQPQTNLALATAILSTIPLLLVFVFGQRHFVAGLTAGAVKG
jgi:cellobiose transport system permease protein